MPTVALTTWAQRDTATSTKDAEAPTTPAMSNGEMVAHADSRIFSGCNR